MWVRNSSLVGEDVGEDVGLHGGAPSLAMSSRGVPMVGATVGFELGAIVGLEVGTMVG